MDKRFCIHVHSKRKRLVDPDGISAKAAIDGMAKAGIFADDNAQYIKEISYTQEIFETDETVISVLRETVEKEVL